MPFWIAYKELKVGNTYAIHYQVAVPITISVEELFKPLVIPAWNSHLHPPPHHVTGHLYKAPTYQLIPLISTGEVSTRSMKMLFSTPGIAKDAEFSPNTYNDLDGFQS